MLARLAIFVGLLVAWSPSGAADALDPFVGDWQGPGVDQLLPAGASPPGVVEIGLQREGTGFRLRWRVPGWSQHEAAFAAAGPAGLYEARVESGTLFGMFKPPTTGDPLKGERLLWARLDGPALIVYSLSLEPSGDFALDRARHSIEEGALALSLSRRGRGGERLRLEARLAPAGG